MTGNYVLGTAPGAAPVLGHVMQLVRDPSEFMRSLPAHGDLVVIRMGPAKAYVVCHPSLFNQVLVDDRTFDRGGLVYDAARAALGNGLVTCPHSVHRRQRRLVQPAFHRGRLPGYAAVMSEHIARKVDSWHDGQQIDAVAEMSDLTTGITAATLFTADQDREATDQTHHDLTTLTREITVRMLMPQWMHTLPIPANLRYNGASRRLRAGITKILADHRSAGGDRGDLLSMLVTARDDDGTRLTDTEIHDHLLIFFVAGLDTTASALAWALHLLATHPDIEQRLHAEVDSVLAGRTARWENLENLKLTGRVVAETLRLYPPAWIFTRTVTADTELGGLRLKAGTTVLLSPYVMHHREELFPDPDVFDPDRWLDQRTAHLPRDGYVPFGGGARKCIGNAFGLAEATLTLASTATRWRLLPVPGAHVRPRLGATLFPSSLPMRVAARNRIATSL